MSHATKTYLISDVKQTDTDWDRSYSPEVTLYHCACIDCAHKRYVSGTAIGSADDQSSVFAPLCLGEFSGRAVIRQWSRNDFGITLPMFKSSVFGERYLPLHLECENTTCSGSYHDADFEAWPADIDLEATVTSMVQGYETFDAAVQALTEFVDAVHAVYNLDEVGKQMLLISLEDGVLLPEAVQLAQAVML